MRDQTPENKDLRAEIQQLATTKSFLDDFSSFSLAPWNPFRRTQKPLFSARERIAHLQELADQQHEHIAGTVAAFKVLDGIQVIHFDETDIPAATITLHYYGSNNAEQHQYYASGKLFQFGAGTCPQINVFGTGDFTYFTQTAFGQIRGDLLIQAALTGEKLDATRL